MKKIMTGITMILAFSIFTMGYLKIQAIKDYYSPERTVKAIVISKEYNKENDLYSIEFESLGGEHWTIKGSDSFYLNSEYQLELYKNETLDDLTDDEITQIKYA